MSLLKKSGNFMLESVQGLVVVMWNTFAWPKLLLHGQMFHASALPCYLKWVIAKVLQS